ncbi:hypothetical protein DFH06DRAFT_1348107 [Mycena polygramma]|nr:hypothetical protein DFH06DRAFT_1348107 [Mycena polygramma]
MSPQTRSIPATPAQSDSPRDPSHAKRRSSRPASSIVSMRRATAKYRARSLPTISTYRARIKAEEDLAEQARVRAREASKKYRQTHAAQLAHRQRIVRMEAYERKHGHHAWLARYEKLQAQRAEAQELQEMRRHEEEFRRMDEAAERRRQAQAEGRV